MNRKLRILLAVLESCCLEWYQNSCCRRSFAFNVLESCCLEWYQNTRKSFYDTMMSFIAMLLKNKLSPQAIRNFHHKIRIFIIKDELLQFSKTNQVISQNVDRLRLVLPFFRKGFFY